MNPNIYTAPTQMEEVPMPNQEWDEAPDRAELDSILREARQVEVDEVNAGARDAQLLEAQAELATAQRRHDAGREAFYQRQIDQLNGAIMVGQYERADRRLIIDQRLDTLADDTNPRALLNELRIENTAADAMRTRANNVATDADTAAGDAGTSYSQALIDWNRTVRYHSSNPTTDPQVLRDRQRTMRELDNRVSGLARAGRMNEAANERRRRHAMYQADYPDAVDYLADRMRLRHEAAWNAAATAETQATSELARWGLNDDPDHPTFNERDIRDSLESMRQAIDAMTPYDSTRAEALASYTRLRYRLEQRCMIQDILHLQADPSFQVSTDREFTENRGIWIHDNNGDEVIIHDDGSTERDEGGEWVRRNATGEVWTQPEEERRLNLVISQENIDNARPLAQTFAEWDVQRTPEAAQAMYDSLNAEITAGNAVEAQHTEAINQFTERIDAIDQVLTQGPVELGAAQTELGTAQTELATLQGAVADPTHPTKRERKAIEAQQKVVDAHQQTVDEIDARMRQARADRPGLVANRDAEYVARQAMRTDLNERRYWHGFIEVSSNRTVQETRTRMLGRQAVTRVLERETDALPDAPELTARGAVRFGHGVTINSTRSDSWVMWVNGSAMRTDNTGRPRYYAPDGYLHP